MDHRLFIKELRHQVDTRIEMATDRKYEYEGEDPIFKLPLTDYQKGLIAGRQESWEFFSRLITDVVKEVRELHTHEDKSQEN